MTLHFNKNSLSEREQQALLAACRALYFDDNSDFGTALWRVVAAFDPKMPNLADEEYLLKRLRKLEPDVFGKDDTEEEVEVDDDGLVECPHCKGYGMENFHSDLASCVCWLCGDVKKEVRGTGRVTVEVRDRYLVNRKSLS